jgi:hypothetical protein
MIVWSMTAETACKFYQLCIDRNAKTEEERTAILLELKDELTSAVYTKRTKEQFIADLARNFSVLKIEQKGHEDLH